VLDTVKFDEKSMLDSIISWEYDVSVFERAVGTPVHELLKISLLVAKTSGPLQEHLCLTVGSMTCYAEVKAAVTYYIHMRQLTRPVVRAEISGTTLVSTTTDSVGSATTGLSVKRDLDRAEHRDTVTTSHTLTEPGNVFTSTEFDSPHFVGHLSHDKPSNKRTQASHLQLQRCSP
jgi:hypothetical protein